MKHHLTRRTILALPTLVVVGSDAAAQASDPLPSWHDRPAKRAIADFVARATSRSSPDYIEPAERIATFDNDGTLWSEQPIYFQLSFVLDRIKALSPKFPQWTTTQPFQAALEGDHKALLVSGEKGLLEMLATSHTGMSADEFRHTIMEWLTTARHPRFNRPYTDLIYRPMRELLDYLRKNEFKTFIVSGGGIEFMRAFAERVYGIPPEQVVGSSGVVSYRTGADGKPLLMKEAKVEFIDDGPGKPIGINRFIGRRPIFAFGNSDGDLEMLEWTAAGTGPRFMSIVHHTDAQREYAYDRQSHIGKLDKALDEANAKRWTVVDMKRDWRTIFS